MAVYTCFDMIADCQAGKPEGWRHFVRQFVHGIRALAAHYGSEDRLREFLLALKDDPNSPVLTMKPAAERNLMYRLRDFLVERLPVPEQPAGPTLEELAAELEDLSATEKQSVWLHMMGYDKAAVADLVQVFPETLDRVYEKAPRLEEYKARSVALRKEAAAAPPENPAPLQAFIDTVDGRHSWSTKAGMERHVAGSWHEIDRFCRLREVDRALHRMPRLTEEEVGEYIELYGVREVKKPLWKRLFAG